MLGEQKTFLLKGLLALAGLDSARSRDIRAGRDGSLYFWILQIRKTQAMLVLTTHY